MSADSTPPIRFAWIRRAPATPGNRAQKMHIHYRDELRLFPNRLRRCALGALILAWAFIPVLWDFFPFTLFSGNGVSLNTLAYAGVFAIAAIGLNLLTGYTGQVSLGHSVFLAVGAYSTAYVGSVWGWPMWLWILFAPAMGWLVGAAVGPFALRLRGNYLVIVTLGLVFIGEHIFRNWKSVTGGNTGTSAAGVEVKLGFIDFENLSLFGKSFGKDESYFWLIWFFVALVAWLTKNVVRTRPGQGATGGARPRHRRGDHRDRCRHHRLQDPSIRLVGRYNGFGGCAVCAAPTLHQSGRLHVAGLHPVHCDDYLGRDGHHLWIDHRCAGDHRSATTDRWHFGRLRCTWSGSQEHRLWSRVCCFA